MLYFDKDYTMSEAIVNIPHLSPTVQRDRFANKCEVLDHYCAWPYLRQPNQPFSSSSPASASSPVSASSPASASSPETPTNISDHFDNRENNESAMSIEGEFDQRVDIMPLEIMTHRVAAVNITVINMERRASAPPLSDCESDGDDDDAAMEVRVQQPPPVQQDESICIICYENFSGPVSPNEHDEEIDDEESYTRKEICDFCQTCKYSVHHKCIDEYRASKIHDAVKHNQRRRSNYSSGTFSIKCLTCAREVEKIHISRNGDIDIMKTQRRSSENESEYDQHRRQHHEDETRVQMQEILQIQNRMQRMRRRQRCNYCKSKLCAICFSILLVGTLLVILFRLI